MAREAREKMVRSAEAREHREGDDDEDVSTGRGGRYAFGGGFLGGGARDTAEGAALGGGRGDEGGELGGARRARRRMLHSPRARSNARRTIAAGGDENPAEGCSCATGARDAPRSSDRRRDRVDRGGARDRRDRCRHRSSASSEG